jgi:D-arabinose 1-dehydrogenase-like Zn-dependent alcohol dehydrogenase
MRAAVLEAAGEVPTVRDFDDPEGPEDSVVDVILAGCNPVDLIMASGKMGQPTTPSVVGKEGIGLLAGRRVYFDSPPDPFGSWA